MKCLGCSRTDAYSPRVRWRISTQPSIGHSHRNGMRSISTPSSSALSRMRSFASRNLALFSLILSATASCTWRSSAQISAALNVGARGLTVAQERAQFLRRRFARPDLPNEVVELHPIRACGTPDQLERLVEAEAVSLGQDSLGLLDRDPRLERLLELGTPLVRSLGDRQ